MLGFLIGLACIVAAITWEGGPITAFYRPSILALVLGGSLGATLTSHSLSALMRGLRQDRRLSKLSHRQAEALIRLSRYAGIVRHQGHLALEKEVKNEPEPLLALSLQALADGASMEEIETQAAAAFHREVQDIRGAERFFEALGGSCPTFGLIGTVVGLVSMMLGMKNPDTMAQGMASSFVATFYGMVLANLLFLPVAGRIRERIREFERFSNNLILGVRLVNSGSAPRSLLERLREPMGVKRLPESLETEGKARGGSGSISKGKGKNLGTSLKHRLARLV